MKTTQKGISDTNEFVYILESWFDFIPTCADFLKKDRTQQAVMYGPLLKNAFRIASIYQILKIIFGQDNSINVKGVVDKIILYFPIPKNKNKRIFKNEDF